MDKKQQQELDEVLKMLDLDSRYRAQCVADLLVTDGKALKKGLERLQQFKRVLRKHARAASA